MTRPFRTTAADLPELDVDPGPCGPLDGGPYADEADYAGVYEAERLAAETLRPTAPEDCRAYPRCGLDVTGHCRCYPVPAAPTVPAPGPCQEAALLDALLKRDAAVREATRATAQLTDAALLRVLGRYEAERARLAALRTSS